MLTETAAVSASSAIGNCISFSFFVSNYVEECSCDDDQVILVIGRRMLRDDSLVDDLCVFL